jgi:hypothetical protein
MDAAGRKREVTRRANELYWGSDESVNHIADRLELSKSALYGMIGPLPAAATCPVCGARVEYANRTARERDDLSCPTCTWEGSESETMPMDPGTNGADAPANGSRLAELAERFDLDRKRIILGSALLGAAVGVAVFTYIRRDD